MHAWCEEAGGTGRPRQDLVRARAPPGAAHTQPDSLRVCWSLHARPGLQAPAASASPSLARSSPCRTACGQAPRGLDTCAALPSPGLALSSAVRTPTSVLFPTGPAAGSPLPGSEWTPDSNSGTNQRASQRTPVPRAVMRSPGNRSRRTHGRRKCYLSPHVPILQMKTRRPREAAVLAGSSQAEGELGRVWREALLPLHSVPCFCYREGTGSVFPRLGPAWGETRRPRAGVARNALCDHRGAWGLAQTPAPSPVPRANLPLCPRGLQSCCLVASMASAQISS